MRIYRLTLPTFAALAALSALLLGACSGSIFNFASQCESDADCDNGRICDTNSLFNRCAVPCDCDSECNDGEICAVMGARSSSAPLVCTTGCRSDDDCPEEGFNCIDQRCQDAACYRGDQCGEGELCDRFNKCVERECERSADCDEGFVCSGLCVSGCFADDDCPGGQGCVRHGAEPGSCTPSACIDDEDCSAGLYCLCGRCVENCESDEECGEGMLCALTMNECQPRTCQASNAEHCPDKECPAMSDGELSGGFLESCCVEGHGEDSCGFRYYGELLGHHGCGIPVQASTDCGCGAGECCLPDGSCGWEMKPISAPTGGFALCTPKSPAESPSCEPS